MDKEETEIAEKNDRRRIEEVMYVDGKHGWRKERRRNECIDELVGVWIDGWMTRQIDQQIHGRKGE